LFVCCGMKESQFLYEKMTLSTCDVVMSAVLKFS
jgi:hypothetical protein